MRRANRRLRYIKIIKVVKQLELMKLKILSENIVKKDFIQSDWQLCISQLLNNKLIILLIEGYKKNSDLSYT